VGKGKIIAIVRAILVDGEDRVLLLRRSAKAKHHPGHWEFPGGGMGLRESLGKALARELREELGMMVERSRLPGAYIGLLTGNFPRGPLSSSHSEIYGLKHVAVSGSEIATTDPWGFFTPEQALALPLTPSAAAAFKDERLFLPTRS
jgi:8-oxo-dGTP pyrophosphatase MutT (NUDIX family)